MLGNGFSSKCPRAEKYGRSSDTKAGRCTDSNLLAPSDSSNSTAQPRGPEKTHGAAFRQPLLLCSRVRWTCFFVDFVLDERVGHVSLSRSSMLLFPLDLFFMHFGLNKGISS